MLIVYIRVSKSDGSQSLDLQRDALLEAGVESHRIYDDLASGRKDAQPNPLNASGGFKGTSWGWCAN